MGLLEKSRVPDRASQPLRARAAIFAAQAGDLADRWRKPILVLALLALVAGCIFSVRELALDISAIRPVPIMTLVLAAIPLSIAYSAVNMMLMGTAAGVTIGFRQGAKISVIAQAAEILPLPGAAIVRTASLIKAGGGKRQSAEVVLGFAVLWVATAGLGAGLALVHHGLGLPLLALSVTAWLFLSGWLMVRIGPRLAGIAITLRIVGVALVAWRLSLAFDAIGQQVGLIDCLTFAFATILGSAAAIVPAGLGVGEGLSALLAGYAGLDPAAAFLAAALSRFAGITVNISAALACFWLSRERTMIP